MKWDSRVTNFWVADYSLRSFLFTLRNPRGVPPRKSPLKAEKMQNTILCSHTYCAIFGTGDCDIYVSDHCNANGESHTCFGTRWSNCADVNDIAFEYSFTDAFSLTVKDIEVFEITY
jgi:hypothetical protein